MTTHRQLMGQYTFICKYCGEERATDHPFKAFCNSDCKRIYRSVKYMKESSVWRLDDYDKQLWHTLHSAPKVLICNNTNCPYCDGPVKPGAYNKLYCSYKCNKTYLRIKNRKTKGVNFNERDARLWDKLHNKKETNTKNKKM